MPILNCEISIHAQPANCPRNERGELQLPADWARAPWGRTFDEALAAIGELPQLYTELDGSLAWNSLPGEERWQLFGCLYDRGPELAYIDLYGTCDAAALAKFFDCVRGSEGQLMVQDRGRGVFFGEREFVDRLPAE
jgi:hypothetical protein